MCDIDYDPPQFYTQADRKARKEYRCDECFRKIIKGETYRNHFGVYDNNKGTTFRTCIHCCVAVDWLMKQCNGYTHGNVMYEILEHAEEYRSMYLYRLYVGMNRHWCKFKSFNELMKVPLNN